MDAPLRVLRLSLVFEVLGASQRVRSPIRSGRRHADAHRRADAGAGRARRAAGGGDHRCAGEPVHAHLGEDLAVVPIAAAAAARHRISLVLTVHTSLQHTLSRTGLRAAVLRVVGGGWQGSGARRAAAVITLTPRLAGVLARDGVDPERIHVIPSGMRPELFNSPDGGDPLAAVPRPRLLFLDRLHPQKGVDVFVRDARSARHAADLAAAVRAADLHRSRG